MRFRRLWRKLESEWVALLIDRLAVERDRLPILRDADFLFGEVDDPTRERVGTDHGVNAVRGSDGMQEALFTESKLEDFVPTDHPLLAVRSLVNESRVQLKGLFNTIYRDGGRASIPPKKLLRARLIQVLFSVRSERQLMEQVLYTLLYR